MTIPQDMTLLLGCAAAIGLVHTLLGPDHYLPFIMMSKVRGWSLARTIWVTALCGMGHVAGSVILGLIGIAAGITLHRLELIESARGEIAAWLLTAFGLVYLAWALVRYRRNRPHSHWHVHPGDDAHAHCHTHHAEHTHVHDEDRTDTTPWVLFTIFVFGPCEPLIPLLMYPAAASSAWTVALVALVFGLVTVLTMLAAVVLSVLGLGLVPARRLVRLSHVIAGGIILLCGVAIHMGL